MDEYVHHALQALAEHVFQVVSQGVRFTDRRLGVNVRLQRDPVALPFALDVLYLDIVRVSQGRHPPDYLLDLSLDALLDGSRHVFAFLHL